MLITVSLLAFFSLILHKNIACLHRLVDVFPSLVELMVVDNLFKIIFIYHFPK